ncbi:hypothetical protein [Methylobacterium sp. 77]|uniref:hypothetical protein n=1 Tax=Methylobacterium sp. 77 TaxID=1101192 RepID=UPI00036DB93D|nr:hypothetical protein [Methylobacterium sp. 77]
MTSETVLAETGLAKTHLAKTVLALTVLIFLTTGRAPGMRELRNPDSESGHARIVHMVKRMSA